MQALRRNTLKRSKRDANINWTQPLNSHSVVKAFALVVAAGGVTRAAAAARTFFVAAATE